MKIGIDVSSIDQNKAGVGYYIYSLTKILLETDRNNEYILLTNNITNVEEFAVYTNALIYEIKSDRPNFKWILKSSKFCRKHIDIFLSPANFSFAILVPNTVQIVHDLAPIKFSKFFPRKGALAYRVQLELAVRRAKKFITPLEAVRQELITFYPKYSDKFYSVGGGFHEWTNNLTSPGELEHIKRKYNLPDKYLLSTGTLEPRKNHINMIKAFKSFSRTNPEFYYVIVGKKGWFFEEIFSTVDKLGLKDKILFLGYVPEDDIYGIYYNASAFVFCSFYEGFGLPPLEAARLSLPILCSEIDSLKEIFKNSVEYANPNDSISISKGMRSIVDKKRVDYTDVLNKYSWTNTAKNILNILQNSLK